MVSFFFYLFFDASKEITMFVIGVVFPTEQSTETVFIYAFKR